MRINLSYLFLFFGFLFSISQIYAVRATPFPITVSQPDGTELTIRLRGDEFFSYKTTIDGYLLVSDSKGVLTYAKSDENGRFTSTNVKVNNIGKRSLAEKSFISKLTPNQSFSRLNNLKRAARISSSESLAVPQKSYPLAGTPKSLVILVNFSDKSFVTPDPLTAFTNLLNEPGYSTNGGTGSARDYFRDNSMGVFIPHFDVVGPYTLPQKMEYYGGNDSANSDNDKNPRQMVIDACKLASNNGIDFAQYDSDNDGIVDNVFVYYAGYNEAEGAEANTVWPHRWTLSNLNTKFDGKSIYSYACTSELRGKSGSNMCGIGTFVHEFGHVLGLPDYYATDDEATHHTLSFWSVMDSGPYLNSGRTPPAYSAYDRFYLKWLIPTELKSPQNVKLNSLTTSNKAYLITQTGNHNLNGRSPSPLEFFTLENRQRTGWDSFLPNSGLLITRIYYNSGTWYNNTPNNDSTAMGVDIIEADGIASENTLVGDVFPGTAKVTTYLPSLRNGTIVNKPLTFIKNESGIVTFRFMGGGDVPSITTNGNPVLFTTVQTEPSESQKVVVSGRKLGQELRILFEVNSHFEIKKQSEPESAWRKSISLTPVDSLVADTDILVRYNPTTPSYDSTHDEIMIFQSDSAETIQISIAGQSSRPVYIVPAVATDATNITTGSFIANWDKVEDFDRFAPGYYITVYNISDGVSEFTEGFDKGLTAPKDWTIMAQAVTSSTVYSGKSVPAIQFKNSDDYIETETYLLPATKLSFFVKSLAASAGSVLVEAWDGTDWYLVDAINVVSSLSEIKTYNFQAVSNYVRFRIRYQKVVAFVAVDDVTVGFSQKIEFNVREKWVPANSDTITHLLASRDYFYKVRTSDRTLKTDKTVLYENITDFSNTVKVTTLEDKPGNMFRVRYETGTLILLLTSTDEIVRVFNTVGQLVRAVKPQSTIIEIDNLPRGQVYIVQVGKRRSKFILTPESR